MEEGSFSLQVVFLFEEMGVLLVEDGVLGLEATDADGKVLSLIGDRKGIGRGAWILLFGSLFSDLFEGEPLVWTMDGLSDGLLRHGDFSGYGHGHHTSSLHISRLIFNLLSVLIPNGVHLYLSSLGTDGN